MRDLKFPKKTKALPLTRPSSFHCLKIRVRQPHILKPKMRGAPRDTINNKTKGPMIRRKFGTQNLSRIRERLQSPP